MSRSLTPAALRSLLSQETDVVWLALLTIDHDDMDAPIRVVNNNANIVSRGNTYLAFPFEINMPDERDDAPPKVSLRIDNVDKQIVQGIQSLPSAPDITLEIVTNADLDQVEIGAYEMKLRSASYDQLIVEGELSFEPVLEESYPAGRFTPADFPGLFS